MGSVLSVLVCMRDSMTRISKGARQLLQRGGDASTAGRAHLTHRETYDVYPGYLVSTVGGATNPKCGPSRPLGSTACPSATEKPPPSLRGRLPEGRPAREAWSTGRDHCRGQYPDGRHRHSCLD